MSIAIELQNVTKRFGDFVAVDDISLQIADGEFFSLLGPSGCGKTTNLRMVAGFELPTVGEIFLHGQPVGQLPPFKRNVNTVFQNYALFPHLTIEQNIGFGLEIKKVADAEIKKRVAEALAMVRLPQIGSRKPAQLSGGQRQRVALARALVNQPEVLLLDEPLGALDLKLRKAMQIELKQIQEQLGITFIFVTHDQEEALVMSDRIAVMNQGQLLQVGTPHEIYEHPTSRFVADFIGETNFLPCTVSERENGWATVKIKEQLTLRAECGSEVRAGQEVTVAIRPEKITLYATKPPTPEHDTLFPGTISEMVYMGTDTRFRIALLEGIDLEVRHQNMSAKAHDARAFVPGQTVYISWHSASARILTS